MMEASAPVMAKSSMAESESDDDMGFGLFDGGGQSFCHTRTDTCAYICM